MTTHAELLAAIDGARENEDWKPFDQGAYLGAEPWTSPSRIDAWQRVHGHDVRLKCYAEYGCQVIETAAVNAHLTTLRAIAMQHVPGPLTSRGSYCTACMGDLWPCPTVALVIDALRRMGVDVDE